MGSCLGSREISDGMPQMKGGSEVGALILGLFLLWTHGGACFRS